jgi:hypothetical protein
MGKLLAESATVRPEGFASRWELKDIEGMK